jgi:steroid delta-isomerase-like uncharacterized protein
MPMDAREAFERGTDAFNAHDLDGFAAIIADDAVYEAPGGMHAEGKAACVEFVGNWLAAFRNAHVDLHRVHFTDGVAVEEGTFRGTHRGVLRSPDGDIPPTHRAVNLGYIQVLEFRDGLTVRFNLSFDRLGMLQQLGLAAAPTAPH